MNRSPAGGSPALAGLALCAGLFSACSHTAGPAPASSAAPARDPAAAFETVRAVLQSPRCANCHPAGDAPLQGDDGHVHLQNVHRGPGGSGVPGLGCTACHGNANPPDSYGAHAPPGVSTEWRMPPPETKMVFVGLGPRELCEQLKDPERNGGRDLAALLDHLSDPLVVWGWSPGYGRRPVSISHAELLSAFKVWAAAGAPCPAR